MSYSFKSFFLLFVYMKEKKKVFLGSDHAAYSHKQAIIKHLNKDGFVIEDLGPHNEDSCDYPDYAKKVAEAVVKENCLGILICGTGIGMSMAANKVRGIRAALCCNEYMAEMAREHNNANVLCLGARVISEEEAIKISDKFLKTDFSGDERHSRRVCKIMKIEE